ncbi:MAG: hypothetical protein WA081_14315 [Desulfosalsimonadaceae bacterium]
MSTQRDLIATKIVMHAILPVMKVILEDDPAMKRRFEGVTAKVQFIAAYEGQNIGAALVFDKGRFEVIHDILQNPDLTFSFGTIEKFNAFLAGKPVIPKIKGLTKVGLLVKFVTLLLAMKILMPNVKPKTPEKRRLKVKMIAYMITTALSQYNKAGDPEMAAWTGKQPDRVYQMSIEPEGIAAYVRIKAGKSKAGRGYYKRRRPFVHMKFNGVDNALAIFLNEVEFVEALSKGFVQVEGSPEYAAKLNDFMQRIQALVV